MSDPSRFDQANQVRLHSRIFWRFVLHDARHVTCFALRFISISVEAFKWFEATPSGGEGMQRGAVAWSDVDGAESVGQWNGCASSLHAPRGRCVLTLAAGCMSLRCGTRALRRT